MTLAVRPRRGPQQDGSHVVLGSRAGGHSGPEF